MVLYLEQKYEYPILVKQINRDLVQTSGHRGEFTCQLEPDSNGKFETALQNLSQFLDTTFSKVEIYTSEDKTKLINSFNLSNGRITSVFETYDDGDEYQAGFLIDYDK